jgi:hypothetical protein
MVQVGEQANRRTCVSKAKLRSKRIATGDAKACNRSRRMVYYVAASEGRGVRGVFEAIRMEI